MNRLIALLAMLCMLVAVGVGCAGTPAQTQAPSATPTATLAPPTPVPEETPVPAEGREIVDMAGRKMVLPDVIKTAFSTGPVSAIYLYTLVPDKLLGWNYELNAIERSVILPQYHDIPNFGMGDAINYEAVIAANPSIAFHVSAINDGTMDDADKLAESLGIPVVMVSSKLEDAPAVYRFMGELFGAKEEAEARAAYAERTFTQISAMNIPEEEKVTVYYGNGEDSLDTAPRGSSHGQILDMANAINVADLELGDGSRVRISPEQLLAWDPDVIVVIGEAKQNLSGGGAAAALMENDTFSTLQAVKNERVYGGPNAPFSWIDRPPGPNRIVGLRWLSMVLYPDYFAYDVDEEVREFYRLFYHVELSDEDLAQLYVTAD